MYFLKTLLSPRSRAQNENHLESYFSRINLNYKDRLPSDYLKELQRTLSKTQDPNKFLKLLISKLEELRTAESIIKLLTIIHAQVLQQNYCGPIINGLQNLEVVINRDIDLQSHEQRTWFGQFYRAYICYLAKLPSISQVMIRASQMAPSLNPDMCLTDLFRLLNQMNLILGPLANAINTVGRYYTKQFKVFDQCYSILKIELLNVYRYLRHLINSIISSPQAFDLYQLETFMQSVSEIEVITDRFEEVLVNKYFKGANEHGQVYINLEDIAKLAYYCSTQSIKDNIKIVQ